MKKLLFVINTMGYGGAERALLDLLKALHSEKLQISLFVLTGQGELACELPPYVNRLNRQYKDCSVLTREGRRYLLGSVLRAGVGKGLLIRRAGYLLRNLWAMAQKGRIQPDKLCWRILAEGAPALQEEYDLAVAYLEGGATYYVADRVKAKKKAAFVHISYAQAGYGRALDLDCYRRIDHIFTVSDEVREHFLEVYPEYAPKTSVFHNLVDRDRICRLAQEGTGFADAFSGVRILTVGRLTPQKRYDVAIEAMARLKQCSPVPVRWYVLGEGALRGQLEQKIRHLGLEKDFQLMGVRKNPYPYYRSCDLYVHATGFEGKSLAIQEAQALGKPILATDCIGNREQIRQDVDGRLCPLDPESLCREILWMITHPEECRAYGARAGEKTLYSTKGFTEFLGLLDGAQQREEMSCETETVLLSR